MLFKKHKQQEDPDAEFNRCLELVKDELQQQMDTIVVNTLRKASEKPPIWWQWLLLFIFGFLGGTGFGALLWAFLSPKPTCPTIQVVHP